MDKTQHNFLFLLNSILLRNLILILVSTSQYTCTNFRIVYGIVFVNSLHSMEHSLMHLVYGQKMLTLKLVHHMLFGFALETCLKFFKCGDKHVKPSSPLPNCYDTLTGSKKLGITLGSFFLLLQLN